MEGVIEREAESLLGNGDVTGALYLRQVTGDVVPLIRAAIRSGSLTDQMVRVLIAILPPCHRIHSITHSVGVKREKSAHIS